MERGGVKKTEGRGWSELRICTGKPERRERKDRDEHDEDRGSSSSRNARIDTGMGNGRREDNAEEDRAMKGKTQESSCVAPTWRRSDSSMHD